MKFYCCMCHSVVESVHRHEVSADLHLQALSFPRLRDENLGIGAPLCCQHLVAHTPDTPAHELRFLVEQSILHSDFSDGTPVRKKRCLKPLQDRRDDLPNGSGSTMVCDSSTVSETAKSALTHPVYLYWMSVCAEIRKRDYKYVSRQQTQPDCWNPTELAETGFRFDSWLKTAAKKDSNNPAVLKCILGWMTRTQNSEPSSNNPRLPDSPEPPVGFSYVGAPAPYRIEPNLTGTRLSSSDLTSLHPLFCLFGRIPHLQPLTARAARSETELKSDRETMRFWLGFDDFDKFFEQLPATMTKVRTGRPSIWTPRYRVAVTLLWIRTGFTLKMLSFLSGRDAVTIRELIYGVLEEFHEWTETMVKLPSIPEWWSRTSEKFRIDFPNTLMFFVDGTVIETFSHKASVLRRCAYNPKHKIPSRTFTMVVDETGRIVLMSDITCGKFHDAKAWNISDFNAKLFKNYGRHDSTKRPSMANPIFAIGGDKAYPCIVIVTGWTVYVTKTAEETLLNGPRTEGFDDDLDDEMNEVGLLESESDDESDEAVLVVATATDETRVLTEKLAQYRAVVERTCRAMKCFTVLSNKQATSGDIRILRYIINVIGSIVNYNMMAK